MRLLPLTLLLATHAAASGHSYRRPTHEKRAAGSEGTRPRGGRTAAEGGPTRHRSTREYPLTEHIVKLGPVRQQRDDGEAMEDKLPHRAQGQHLTLENAADKIMELPAPGSERTGEANKGHQSARGLLRKRLLRITVKEDGSEVEHRHKHGGGKHDVGENGHHVRGDKKHRDGEMKARGADLKGGDGAVKASGDAKHEDSDEKHHGGDKKDGNDKREKHRNRGERHNGGRKKDREKKDKKEKIVPRAGEVNKGSETKADRKGDDDRKKKGESAGSLSMSMSMSTTERKKTAGAVDVTKAGRQKVQHKKGRGGDGDPAMSMRPRAADLKGAEKGGRKEGDGDVKRKKAGAAEERKKGGATEDGAEGGEGVAAGDENNFVIDFNDEDEEEPGGAGNATLDDLAANAMLDIDAADAMVTDPTTAASVEEGEDAATSKPTMAKAAKLHHAREDDSGPSAAAEHKGKSGKVNEATAEQSAEGAREEEYHSAPANSIQDVLDGNETVAATEVTAPPPGEPDLTTTPPNIVTYTEWPEAEMLAQQGQTMRKPDPKPAPPGPAADVDTTQGGGDVSALRQEVANLLLGDAAASGTHHAPHQTAHGKTHHAPHHGRQHGNKEGAMTATEAQAMALVEDKLSPQTPDYVASSARAIVPRIAVALGLCLLETFAHVFAT